MKALTIKQPWASLIVNNYKKYEFRSWKTNYRGKILIHAGLNVERDYIKRFSCYNIEYITGAIIGEAELIGCILVTEEFQSSLEAENILVYGNHVHIANYAWKLTNIKKYEKPIVTKGKLGLWNYDK